VTSCNAKNFYQTTRRLHQEGSFLQELIKFFETQILGSKILQILLLGSLEYSGWDYHLRHLILKMGLEYSSTTLVSTYNTTWSHKPKNHNSLRVVTNMFVLKNAVHSSTTVMIPCPEIKRDFPKWPHVPLAHNFACVISSLMIWCSICGDTITDITMIYCPLLGLKEIYQTYEHTSKIMSKRWLAQATNQKLSIKYYGHYSTNSVQWKLAYIQYVEKRL
jgi:hypothetical protein